MQVTVIDSICSDLFDAELRADHVECMALRGWAKTAPIIDATGKVTGSRIEIKHTDFIAYINECAL